MDRLTRIRRSWLMSRVGGKNTLPERTVRKIVSALGYRYRLHVAKLPGKPDLVFASRCKVIFVHGCFWHGHKRCRLGKLPKSRLAYWSAKIEANRVRDKRQQVALRRLGWRTLTVWQCQLKDTEKQASRIHEFLES